MKKYLFILATAAIVASCSDTDTLKKDIQTGNEEAISFTSYTGKQTRANENSDAAFSWYFYNHHETFQVWAYKNTSTTLVFNGDVVTVGQTTAANDGEAGGEYTYTYSPLRYWDKSATTYEFYAAAPSGTKGNWTFVSVESSTTDDIDEQNECYFTTSSTLQGDNLSTSSNYAYTNSFKSAANDVDKLIATAKSVPNAQFKDEVQLEFMHILSRLNVTIKKDASLEPVDHKNQQEVKLVSLTVHNFKATGSYSEATAGVTTGSNARWDQTNLSGSLNYTGVANTVVSKDAKYVIQSLVIPQNAAFEAVALDGQQHASTDAVLYADYLEYNEAKGTTLDETDFDALSVADKTKTPAGTSVAAVGNDSKPYLVLTYTIQQTYDASGVAIAAADLKAPETFVVYYNLANAFGLNSGNLSFNEGWQNTLNITIKPAAIVFSANVAAWSTNLERGVRFD